jgi:hydrogenase/urease accessory protein HupE
MTRPLLLVACCLITLAAATVAHAHELRPAYLEVRQTGPDTYDVMWKVPARGELRLGLYVRLPKQCSELAARTVYPTGDAFIERWQVQCPGGLSGKTITVDGLASSLTDVLVRLESSDGPTQTVRLNAARTSFVAQENPNWRQLAAAYTSLGVEHILLGVDHLLFVLGLMMIVRSPSTLVKTITAFTIAHSITLGLAVFGMVNAPSRPVDAAIALSIAFVGAEIVHARRGRLGLTYRYPWIVAFAFGLLHGLGFAGALTNLGLPAADVPVALLFFNLGVELGQLCFVALVLAMLRSFRILEIHWARWTENIPAYTVGTLGAFWAVQRTVMIFAGS